MGYSPWSPKSRTQLSDQTTTMCVLRSACVSFALAVAGLLRCRLSLSWRVGTLSLTLLRLLGAVAPLEEHSLGLVDSAAAA